MSRPHSSRDVHSVPVLYFPVDTHGLAMATMPASRAAILGATSEAACRSLPDALRCGYTSKRCENPRTVKKSGGLHRFCAYHRERANKNQWRVDNRRRLLRRMGQGAEPSSECGSPRSTTSETNEDTDTVAELGGDRGDAIGRTDDGHESLVSLADPAGSPNTLSEQDAKILNSMLFSDDDDIKSGDVVKTLDDPTNAELGVDGVVNSTPAFVSRAYPCVTSVSADAQWGCVCSQCLAWSTVFFYQDAMEAARKTRLQTYARV